MVTKITTMDGPGFELLAEVEGLVLHPYLDSANIPTIGIGATHYENGVRVTMKDTSITKQRAIELCHNLAKVFFEGVDSVTRDDINQNQFNALSCFCYNGGIGMLKMSTLLKKVNVNPNDPTIADEFRKFTWGHKDGVAIHIEGLISRREKEILMYFKP